MSLVNFPNRCCISVKLILCIKYCVLFNIVSLEDLDSQIQNVANMRIQSQRNVILSPSGRSYVHIEPYVPPHYIFAKGIH